MQAGGRLWLWPLVGSIGAILISPLLSLATGQDFFYNLWLVVMMAALWARLKLTRREVGSTMGDGTSYSGRARLCRGDREWPRRDRRVGGERARSRAQYSAGTVARADIAQLPRDARAVTLITEDGFFRGALLWGAASAPASRAAKTVIWTSVAPSAWRHLAVPIIDPDFAQSFTKGSAVCVWASTAFGIADGPLAPAVRTRSSFPVLVTACGTRRSTRCSEPVKVGTAGRRRSQCLGSRTGLRRADTGDRGGGAAMGVDQAGVGGRAKRAPLRMRPA